MKNYALAIIVAALFCISLDARDASAQASSVLTTGLQGPNKIITAGQSHLLVSETGTPTPNSGRIALVHRIDGSRRTLIDGLPSGFNTVEQAPSGPSGIKLNGVTLYVTIGQGDSVIPAIPTACLQIHRRQHG